MTNDHFFHLYSLNKLLKIDPIKILYSAKLLNRLQLNPIKLILIILQFRARMAEGLLNQIATSPKLDDEYQVQSIIDRKNTKEGLMYRVKWKGFHIDESTWEPLTNLINSLDCVKQFETELRQLRKNSNNARPMALEDSDHQVPTKNKNSKFKQDRIFQKKIKYEDKKKRKEEKKKQKIKENRENNEIKSNKQRQLESCEEFCVLISEYSQNIQKQQNHQQQQINVSQHFSAHDDFKNYLEQSKNNYFTTKFEQLNADDNDQADSKLILGNLNPHNESERQNTQFIDQIVQDKSINITVSQSKNRILGEKDPIIRNKNAKINNIFEADGRLFAEIKLKQKTKGVVDFQVLKKQKQTLKIQTQVLQNLMKPK